jgi:hypothetical protein
MRLKKYKFIELRLMKRLIATSQRYVFFIIAYSKGSGMVRRETDACSLFLESQNCAD